MLVNPPVLAVLEPWYDTPDFGRAGLAYLAAYLRQYPGFEIQIVDAKFERLNFQQVLDRVRQWQPDLVGLTAYTNEIKPAAYQAGLIKQQFPEIVTVIGGVHLTAIPKQTMQEFPSFDIGVIGEGEITFHELCRALRDHDELSGINGLIFRKNQQIVQTAPRPRIQDQDSIPFPAWDLLPPAKTYFVQSIRGCPLNCIFCMNPNGRIARQRSIPNVMAELQLLVKEYAPQRISFGDELFSVDMPRTHALLDAMIEQKFGDQVSWDAQTHVRYVDFELFQKMKKAGIHRIELGIETGDERKLKKMGKGTSLKMIEVAHQAARKAKVPAGSFFLFGLPNESVASIKQTIDLAVKINPILPMFGLMTPYPGTEVARLAAEGKGGYRLMSTDWDEYNKQIGGALEFAQLSRSQIERLQLWAYIKVFLWNGRFWDFIKLVWEYRTGAWSALKKMVLGQKVVDLLHRPPDYEAVIDQQGSIEPSQFIQARKDWQELQTQEMKWARKHPID